MSLGYGSYTSATNAIAIGQNSRSTQPSGIALGYNARCYVANGIALGSGATFGQTTVASSAARALAIRTHPASVLSGTSVSCVINTVNENISLLVPNAPVLITGNYTMLARDTTILVNASANLTITLIAAASNIGKKVHIRSSAGFTVFSATSNVRRFFPTVSTTNVITAPGKTFVILQSDGTNWGVIFETPNAPPVVNAGADASVVLSGTLSGTVSDDGLGAGPLTTLWTLDSGPIGGTAMFSSSTSVTTNVTFNMAGTYVLRLTANDGLLQAFDTVTITAFGATGSILFPGTLGNRITIPIDTDFILGTGDFTIEWFQKLQTKTMGTDSGGFGSPYMFQLDNNGFFAGLNLYYSTPFSSFPYTGAASQFTGVPGPSGGASFSPANSPLFQVGEWRHTAACRNGSTISFFQKGVKIVDISFGSGSMYQFGSVFTIGNNPHSLGDVNNALQGLITNFRVVKGTALYSGSSYTVPTSPLTAIPGTSLLLNATDMATFLTDSSGLSKSITDATGVLTYSTDTPF